MEEVVMEGEVVGEEVMEEVVMEGKGVGEEVKGVGEEAV